jgi:hypothetical protein
VTMSRIGGIADFTTSCSICCTKHHLNRFFAVFTTRWSNLFRFPPIGHLINDL